MATFLCHEYISSVYVMKSTLDWCWCLALQTLNELHMDLTTLGTDCIQLPSPDNEK